ncbi:uncharacterized protein LOC111708184 [Eurytemora carolleeae]|uniref:uncharacterized protein LOC111708184 n=1 Tax=Eurytemora carolleeae TaxID=1294199 RepID=UPI000C775526|nr:uncharacterized protein LOC111708184 [Eurytemora carolleeae]|eukprot:XP_023337250.1 uncharacterized protein LOC111708184 [Eurytemora affinis]
MTPCLVKFIFLPLPMLVSLNILNIMISSAFAYNNIPQPKVFLEPTNVPVIILIPFQIFTMYTYKVFISLAGPNLPGTYPKLRGMLIFIMFIMGKTTTGIFGALKDMGFLGYMESLPCINIGQMILPPLQLGLIIPVALIIPPLYSRSWKTKQVKMDEDEGLTKHKESPASTPSPPSTPVV